MTDAPAAADLSKLYNGLKSIIGNFRCCQVELHEAKFAMEGQDVERFKDARRMTLDGVSNFMNNAWDCLFTEET